MAKVPKIDILGMAKLVGGAVVVYNIITLLKNWNGQAEVVYSCQGIKTFQDSFYIQAATDLETLFYEDITEDENSIIAILVKMLTDADVCELVRVYGKRGPFYAANLTLPVAVVKYLSKSDIQEINDSYVNNNMKFRF
jgi:hypothetical protein